MTQLCEKAQASTEYLLIIGISTLLVLPFIYYGTMYKDDLNYKKKEMQINDALNMIKQYSDFVYNQGEGSLTTITITLPRGISNIELGNNYISIRTKTKYGLNDFIKLFDYNLTGRLPQKAGAYELSIKAIKEGIEYDYAQK